MSIHSLARRGWSNRRIAKSLEVSEGTIRYHRRRKAEGATDGRARQQALAAAYHEAIVWWLEGLGESTPPNLAALHDHLVEEHGYPGSRRSVQRYCARAFPPPPKRARRRVETPPGAQGQVDWAHFPEILIAGRRRLLLAFHLTLSWSRHDVVVWAESKDQLSWHHAHNEALRRQGGVPASLRVDNEKTAMARGAGAWGQVNRAYARYAHCVRFHIDACPPRSPGHKGKVERKIRDQRLMADPARYHWRDLEELQAWSDERMARAARLRTCPATGSSVQEAWQEEKRCLQPLPLLPEPFDLAVTRTVGRDCLVAFEGRSYSVPFALVGRRVEVRGCARTVQVLADARLVASHPRRTPERILIDPAHYEGKPTPEVLPPQPLGKMGRRLQEIAAMPPERRPIDLYAALAEVAR